MTKTTLVLGLLGAGAIAAGVFAKNGAALVAGIATLWVAKNTRGNR